jgi:hypothetical protein
MSRDSTMTKKPINDDIALDYLEMLDEECWAMEGQAGPSDAGRREAYRAARLASAAAAGRGGHEEMRAQAALEAAKTALRHELLARLHRAGRSALCFSGGGIRSATFGLGVLQGLAAHSPCEGGKRPQLLGEFDYLSTVSGGGYLGSWFSAWAAREATTDDTVSGGVAAVIRKLSKNPDTGFDPEPPEVLHLRSYSNYLIPRLGILSGDTWAVIGTVIRNMFLNWTVLVPLIAAILLIPEAAQRVLQVRPQQWLEWAALVAGFAFGVLGTWYIGFDLPSAGNARGDYARYVAFCLVPLIVSATLLNTFWVWLQHPIPSASSWNVVHLGRPGIKWWHFAAFGALMYAVGMASGIATAMWRFHRPAPWTGIVATGAAVVTGALGGAVAYVLVHLTISNESIAQSTRPFYVAVAFPLVVALFLFAGALLVGLTSYITEDKDREWWARSGGILLSVALAWLVFATVVLYSEAIIHYLTWTVSSVVGMLTGWGTARLGGSSDTLSGRRHDAGAAASRTTVGTAKELASRFALPIFLFMLALILARANAALLGVLPWQPAVPVLAVLYVAIGLFSSYYINVNNFSLHAMYKLRLARAYLGASNPHREKGAHRFTGFDEQDDVLMCKLSAQKPLHVINMALNLVGGTNLAWQQRKAESFTSTRLHTGGLRVGYRSSKEYGGRYKDSPKKAPISLATVMTISGAAASPNMGYNSSPLLTLVMTLFNARLGWWLGNPAKVGGYWKFPGPKSGVRPFVDEALGLTDDRNRWVYLSDGGHFDNLGLYEMILRRCRLIVVCDAGADPKFGYEDLGNAVRKIRVDLGVSIEFTGPMPAPVPVERADERPPHCAIGRIRYDAVDPGQPRDGTLIYIKASLTGDEPPDVRHYAFQNPSFPHQTTTDQFFDEAQFESYRRLGLHIVECICDLTAAISPPDKPLDLDEFTARVRTYCAAFTQHSGDDLVLRMSAGPLTRVWKAVSDAWRRQRRD